MYGDASGQKINLLKSPIMFRSKIDPYMCQLIGHYMGIEKVGGDGSYLGLLECFNGLKKELLAFITDHLKSRLSGWYSMALDGKEVLLKSVAMALPVYAMTCF